MKKILAPTDFSELSLLGIRYALEMARSRGTVVIVHHVVGDEEANPHDEGFYAESSHEWLLQQRKRALAELLRENFAESICPSNVRLEVDVGLPDKKIVEKATKDAVDMIVISTHGRTGLLHMLIGSVTEKVVRRARCPVLSIRPTK